MKWRYTPEPLKDYSKWHVHFAWTPILIKDHKYWLCNVMRQAYSIGREDPVRDARHIENMNDQIRKGYIWPYWRYQEVCYYY